MDVALKQLADIQTTRLPSGYLKFDIPNNRKKDFAYTLLYAHWGVQQVLKSRMATMEPVDLGEPAISSQLGELIFGH